MNIKVGKALGRINRKKKGKMTATERKSRWWHLRTPEALACRVGDLNNAITTGMTARSLDRGKRVGVL